jgi:hypothetical protein
LSAVAGKDATSVSALCDRYRVLAFLTP